jgi:hydrogenase nickel incorporation protein HypB
MSKKIQLGTKILSANEEYARQNSELLRKKGKFCLNMISSPGSGKTAILTQTITDLRDKIKIGVIEGDIQTQLDSERIRAVGAPAVQINTKGACHLSAAQVGSALTKLPLDETDLVFVENVGNLVCPSALELGEDAKVVVLSVAEGDDKPAKYPAIFSKSKVLLINKTDLLVSRAIDFDIERVKTDTRRLNKDIEIFCVSARTGEGMNGWYDWLLNTVHKKDGR